MATVSVSTPVSRPTINAKYDRRFYTTLSVLMALTVIVGFAPTYYLRLVSGQSPTTISQFSPVPAVIHLHAIAFSTWVVLFVVQTGLVAAHRTAVHRKLGVFGGVLAAAMVVLGYAAAINGARRGTTVPGVDPFGFTAIPMVDVTMFAIFVALALVRRRDKEAHKRLMLLAYVNIIGAAVARLPGFLPLGPLVFYAGSFVFMIAGMLYDRVSRHAIHPVYKWAFPVLLLGVPLRLFLAGFPAWQNFARFLVQHT
jgi:hypothetical protein